MDRPWELDKEEITIVRLISSEIVGETQDDYDIEFFDEDYSIVEAKLSKGNFKHLPHPVGVGTHFIVILFSYQKKSFAKVCPVMEYWHESWKVGG